jgi:hypothetical protein
MAYAAYQSAKTIEEAYERDKAEGTGGQHTTEAIATEAGGWAGAIVLGEAGATLGLATGPLAPIASPLLGLAFGAIGYFGGKALTQGIIDSGKSLIDSFF